MVASRLAEYPKVYRERPVMSRRIVVNERFKKASLSEDPLLHCLSVLLVVETDQRVRGRARGLLS
jgi:hypothetical protein